MANGRGSRVRGGRSRGLRRFPVEVVFSSNLPEALKALEKHVVEKVLRSMAYAGIHTLYVGLLRNVPFESGVLRESLYQWHDNKRSGAYRQIYTAGPNKKEAPYWYNVEFGHVRYNRRGPDGWLRSKSNPNARGPGAHDLPGALEKFEIVPPSPYLRPTWEQYKSIAIRAMSERATEKMKEFDGPG